MKLFLLLFFILRLNWALAQNPSDVFLGITYSQARIQDTSGTFEPASLSVGLGVIAMPNLALEAYVLNGTHHASNTIAPRTTATVQILSGYGFGVRPFVQLGNGWSAYVKLGRQYGAQDVVVSGPTVQRTTHATYAHTTYGVGTSYNLNARWSVALEHGRARSVPGENTRTSATGLGLRYMF